MARSENVARLAYWDSPDGRHYRVEKLRTGELVLARWVRAKRTVLLKKRGHYVRFAPRVRDRARLLQEAVGALDQLQPKKKEAVR